MGHGCGMGRIGGKSGAGASSGQASMGGEEDMAKRARFEHVRCSFFNAQANAKGVRPAFRSDEF